MSSRRYDRKRPKQVSNAGPVPTETGELFWTSPGGRAFSYGDAVERSDYRRRLDDWQKYFAYFRKSVSLVSLRILTRLPERNDRDQPGLFLRDHRPVVDEPALLFHDLRGDFIDRFTEVLKPAGPDDQVHHSRKHAAPTVTQYKNYPGRGEFPGRILYVNRAAPAALLKTLDGLTCHDKQRLHLKALVVRTQTIQVIVLLDVDHLLGGRHHVDRRVVVPSIL